MVSNGWSKECTITALIQFEDAVQTLQMTPKEKIINLQFVLHATSQHHIYKSTMTQVGININANNGPTSPTPARYQALLTASLKAIFGPNDRHLQNQYLGYGIITCDLPICYFYGRYRSLCEMMGRMPGNDPVPTEMPIFNAQPDEHRDNFLHDHPSPHNVTHEELLSFIECLAPIPIAPPLQTPPPLPSAQPHSDAPTDMPHCPLHPNGRHDSANC
jgi:hypothetical protein